jgi:hypothetical protein
MDHLETEEGVVPLVEDYVVAFHMNLEVQDSHRLLDCLMEQFAGEYIY